MTDLPPDCAALFAGVLDSPRDPLPKLVLADWLDERGEPALAHCFRWCAAYGRHPGRGDDPLATRGAWRGAWVGEYSACEADHLLPPVAREVAFTGRNYATPWDAFAALADALEAIAAVVRLPAH